jgi:hypothetical protein
VVLEGYHVGITNFVYFFIIRRSSPPWARASSFTRFLDHTQRRTTVGRTPLDEWSARSQRSLPENTQHLQQTNIHAPSGTRTHNLSRRAAADLHLRPRGQWDRKGTTLRNPFSLVLHEDFLVLDAVKEFPASHIRGRNLVLSKMNSLNTVMPHNFTLIYLILLLLYSWIRHLVSCKFNEIFQYILSLYVFMLQYPKLKTVYFFFEWLVNFYRTTQSNSNKLTIFSHRPDKLLSRFDIFSQTSSVLTVFVAKRSTRNCRCE